MSNTRCSTLIFAALMISPHCCCSRLFERVGSDNWRIAFRVVLDVMEHQKSSRRIDFRF